MEDDVIMFGQKPGEISEDKPVIKVIGVGGGGTNAVNHMYELGINNVEFVVCNTDNQSLLHSPVPLKVQLGPEGHGAGNDPDKGREAADYSLQKIKEILEDSTKMVFITAGMGGGTGTGAAPLIAKTAKDSGILTVGIVTIPFKFEGKRRIEQALQGVEQLRNCVDSILVINTDRISKIYPEFTLEKAFACADDILATAAKGIAEIITLPGYINVDLEDVKTVMTDSGSAVMGAAKASGDGRALTAIQSSLDSPLLLSTNLNGAKDILLNIAYGSNGILVDELTTITEYLQSEVQCDENQIIWGAVKDPSLAEDELNITIVATGFGEESFDLPTNGKRSQDLSVRSLMGSMKSLIGNEERNSVQRQKETDGLYSRYYGSSTAKPSIISSPRENLHPELEDLPAEIQTLDEDEDSDDGPISNFSGLSSQSSSKISMNEDGVIGLDKNDYLHGNVD